MGMLVAGRWTNEDRTIQNGAYVRPKSAFSSPLPEHLVDTISKQPGRFHLIASLSCPWSHRLTLLRAVKRLEGVLPMHIACGPRTEGYRVAPEGQQWLVPGTGLSIEHLHQLYTLTDPALTARVTVPLLWDAVEKAIVSNESAMLMPTLDAVVSQDAADWTLSPSHLQPEIATLSGEIQTGLSNAVYRAGKAREQSAYDTAVEEVFATLSALEDRLSSRRYLHGSALTETDLRLWPTLARFDLVYFGHFKCSQRRLVDFPNLWGYSRDVCSWPGVADTYEPRAILSAYYGEDRDINPSGVVPVQAQQDWHTFHDRDRFGARQVWTRQGALNEYNSTTGCL